MLKGLMAQAMLIAMIVTTPVAALGEKRSDPASPASAQRGAMRRLASMDGAWKGPGWILLSSGEKHQITQTKRVGLFLDETIRIIDDRRYEPDGSLGLGALGIISFDPGRSKYTMRSYVQGHAGDYPLTVTREGFSWEIPAGLMTIRYSAIIKRGTWREIGERIIPGREPTQFIEMTLTRVGDSDWPSGGTIEPESENTAFTRLMTSKKVRDFADYLKAHPRGVNHDRAIAHIRDTGMGYVDDDRGILIEVYEFGTTDSIGISKGRELTAKGTRAKHDVKRSGAGRRYVVGTVNLYVYKQPLDISRGQIVIENKGGVSEAESWKFSKAWLAERILGFSGTDDRDSVRIEDEERIGFLIEGPSRDLDSAIFKVAGIPLATVGALREKHAQDRE